MLVSQLQQETQICIECMTEQLTIVLKKMIYCLSFVFVRSSFFGDLPKKCQRVNALQSMLFLKLQRAYVISLDDDLQDVPEDLTDINAICGQHMEFVCLTNQDIEEWWNFYGQEFSLPELV